MTEGQGSNTPPGWYPDPEGHGERWWNGMSWGELRSAPQGQAQQQRPSQPYGQDQPQRWGQQQQQPAQQQPQAQQPRGAGLRCVNCQWTDFAAADFVLTPGGAIFDRGVGMATAQCLICRRCGFIHWFAAR